MSASNVNNRGPVYNHDFQNSPKMCTFLKKRRLFDKKETKRGHFFLKKSPTPLGTLNQDAVGTDKHHGEPTSNPTTDKMPPDLIRTDSSRSLSKMMTQEQLEPALQKTKKAEKQTKRKDTHRATIAANSQILKSDHQSSSI